MAHLFRFLFTRLTLRLYVQSLAALVQAAACLRLCLILMIFGFVSALMSALALFVALAYGVYQYTRVGAISVDPILLFLVFSFALWLLLFGLSMSQHAWLRMWKIDQMVASLERKR